MKHRKFFATRPLLNDAQMIHKYMVDALKPYKRDLKPSSVSAYKYELQFQRISEKLKRRAPIAVIRALGHKHYFAGCYIGAENY